MANEYDAQYTVVDTDSSVLLLLEVDQVVFTMTSSNSDPTKAGQGDTVTISTTASYLSAIEIDINSQTLFGGRVGGEWQMTYSITSNSPNGNLSISSMTATDVAGNTGNSFSVSTSVEVDLVAPTVASVDAGTTTAAGSYGVGDVVSVGLSFSEDVVVGSGTQPVLLFTNSLQAAYNSSASTSTVLVFSFTVQTGQTTNGANLGFLSTTSGLSDPDNTITDSFGNDANTVLPQATLPNAIVIDGISPTITTFEGPSGTFKIGDSVGNITVVFSEDVVVQGSPTLTLSIGAATFVGQDESDATRLHFSFVVATSMSSSSVAATSLTGTIYDTVGNAAVLTLPTGPNSLAGATDIIVDGVAPSVSQVTTSTSYPSNTYRAGQSINVRVVFTETLDLSNVDETATFLTLLLDGGATNATNVAAGSTGTYLIFTYLIQAGDSTADLSYVDVFSLILGGTLTDVAGNTASLTLPTPGDTNSLSAQRNIVIDGVAPTFSAFSVSSSGGLVLGEFVTITVTFTETLVISGSGQLKLTLSVGTTRTLTMTEAAGTNSTLYTFQYTVQTGDTSNALDVVSTASLTCTTTVADVAGNTASLSLPAPSTTGNSLGSFGITVDGIQPTVIRVVTTSVDGIYGIGAAIGISVEFSEAVNATNDAAVALDSGGTAVYGK